MDTYLYSLPLLLLWTFLLGMMTPLSLLPLWRGDLQLLDTSIFTNNSQADSEVGNVDGLYCNNSWPGVDSGLPSSCLLQPHLVLSLGGGKLICCVPCCGDTLSLDSRVSKEFLTVLP